MPNDPSECELPTALDMERRHEGTELVERNSLVSGDTVPVKSPTTHTTVVNRVSHDQESFNEEDWVDVVDEQEKEKRTFWARKVHDFFSYTAVPTAFLIGLFFLALFVKARIQAHTVGRIIAGYCTGMSVLMTSLLIYCHLAAYTNPIEQRRIIRILLMVPIYAIDSYLALWRHEWAPVVGLIRDCYESYVIYTFFCLLMGYLGGEDAATSGRHRNVKWMFPMCCLGNFVLTKETIKLWKVLLVQYMIFKPLMSAIAVYLLIQGKYDESSWSYKNPHIYFVVAVNISVTLAFTSLVYFFMEFKEDLKQHNPVGKFAAVKAVVFLSFWQSVVLGVLVHLEIIQGSKEGLWTKEEVSTGVQDFLICLEMLLMCYVHHKVFPEAPYVGPKGPTGVSKWAILHALSVRDVVQETMETALPGRIVNL